jgi:hypothetical protein
VGAGWSDLGAKPKVAVRAGEGDIGGVPALGMDPERAFEDGALVCLLDFA